MSIQELSIKFKAMLAREDILLSALILLVSLVSFSLGRVSITPEIPKNEAPRASVTESENRKVEGSTSVERAEVSPEPVGDMNAEKGYVASKNGTKYHLPWCGSAKQIKEENKVWFRTKEDAEKAGYTPASNCPGI